MPENVILDAVIRMVEEAGFQPAARVLDLSCGDGDLLERLDGCGFSVEGTHFREDDYILKRERPILKKIPLHANTDLQQALAFPDQSFDIVLATEVLEHLPAHASLLREIGRILAPGGMAVFTTPNIHRLVSRLQFLLTGTHAFCGARLGWNVPPDELYSTHFHPVYFPVMHSLLAQSGLRIRKLGRTRTHPAAYPLLLLLSPLLVPATLVECAHFMKRSPEGGRDLLKWMWHPNLLLSKQLVIGARKI